MGFTIRDFTDLDEPSWLRCRVLSFLGSSYYDDVKIERTHFEGQSLRLVAVCPKPEGMATPGDDEVVGILDVELWTDDGAVVATIDTVAVHPDHQRAGIADALLARAVDSLESSDVRWLDAWTREDPASNGWYRAQGFALDQTYLHVYKDDERGDPDDGHTAPFGLKAPVKAFFHAPDEDPAIWRERFARVHQCRRYLRGLNGASWPQDPRLAACYDVECAGRWDHDYYLTLAQRLGVHRVTDIGAGTGVLAIDLAAAGYAAIGLEPAAAMLEAARAKSGADSVTWIHGYADALPDTGADLVVMEGHVAQYFITDADWEQVLEHAHRHLSPGGYLAFESRNPAARAWEGWTAEATRAAYPHPDGGSFTSWVQVEQVHEQAGAVGGQSRGPVVTHVGHTVLDHAHLAYPESLRFRTRAELDESLVAAGFEVLEVAGDWDGAPALSNESPELIVLSRRR